MNWDKTIFLAHANEDKPYIRKLYEKLKDNGLEPWLDEEDLMPGSKWDDKIEEAIKNARFFLACLSTHSVSKSGYVQKELRMALKELERRALGAIYFIPALIEDIELPNITVGTISLKDYQAAKIFDEEGLQKLIKSLKQHINIIEEVKSRENPTFSKLRQAIFEAQTETALRLLIEYVKNRNDDMYNSVLLLSSRYGDLSKQNMLGLITLEKYAMEKNRIVFSILEIIKILEEKENNK